MKEWFITNFPNVVQQGWYGETGWWTSIVQTLYMTFWSAIFGGIAGLIFGVALVLFDNDGIIPNKVLLTSLIRLFHCSVQFHSLSYYWPSLPCNAKNCRNTNRYDCCFSSIVSGCLSLRSSSSSGATKC